MSVGILRSSLLLAAVLYLLAGNVALHAADRALVLAGSTGVNFRIEGSDDFETWHVVLDTVVNSDGVVEVPYSQLGNYRYYRASEVSSGEIRATGLTTIENSGDSATDQNRLQEAHDRVLEIIAEDRAAKAPNELRELFSTFATQSAFSSAKSAADSATASTDAQGAANRVLEILTRKLPADATVLSAADIESMRAQALAVGLSAGVANKTGSSSEATAALSGVLGQFSAENQLVAIALAQIAAGVGRDLPAQDPNQVATLLSGVLQALNESSSQTGGSSGATIGSLGGIASNPNIPGGTIAVGGSGGSAGGTAAPPPGGVVPPNMP